MILSKIIKNLDYVKMSGSIDLNIDNIIYDSRKGSKNSVFVAISGFQTDGHMYIEQAIKNGAIVIIHEKELNKYRDEITYIMVEDSRKALSCISNNYFNNPSKDLFLVGVTGTNGKTSVTFILKQIIKEFTQKVGVIGTVGSYINEKKILSNNRTTPESLELQEILDYMKKDNCEHVLMEVSSHSLELERVKDVNFDIGIFTNLSQDHLDFHKTFENYLSSKSKLFLKTTKANIINGDDEYSKLIIESIRNKNIPIYTYGVNNNCDYRANNIEYSIKGIEFILNGHNLKEKFFIPIIGNFTVYNTISAIIAAIIIGIPIDVIRKALLKIKAIPGRMELLVLNEKFNIMIDYAHTPDGLKKVLESTNDFVKGRLILVFGCGGDRDKLKRPIMGEIAGKLSDLCIVTSDNPRSEEPQEIIDEILVGVKKTNVNHKVIVDRKEAIKYSIKIAREGDLILLAGKGHEKYQILKDDIIDFNEKEIIKQILSEEIYCEDN